MYVGKVSLRNIRGFESLDFDLQRPDGSYAGWTVFTGDNGSGKSALLRAIALALVGRDTARSLQPGLQGWIRQHSNPHEGVIQVEVVKHAEDDGYAESGRTAAAATFPAKLLLRNGGKEVSLEVDLSDGRKAGYRTPERSIWSTDATGWFACGYGPFRRVFGNSPEAARLMAVPATARFVTMFEEAASLAEVDQWLRNLKHKELEQRSDGKAQLAILLEILRDDLMPNQITVDRVDSDGLWLKDRNGVQLSWKEMSDGYRAALALVTDIVRHMIETFGTVGLTFLGPDNKLRIGRSGVVLIDEVDAHLHPEWQRTIGFWLKDHFPNVQFLVTSHSPLICQAADDNGLFVLPEPGSGDQPRALSAAEHQRIIAGRPDTILLSPAFGLPNSRSPRAVESRRQYSKLKAKLNAGIELTPSESYEFKQLELFAKADEEL
jgi:energy-coupling factor transporter ATP-binding protein EcfA2